MAAVDEPRRAAGVSDAAVRAATGRGWAEWFALLDAFDVRAHGHAAAARHLAANHGCPDWWSRMVTVGYEQTHGLRKKHETADGYQVGGNRTLPVSVERLYQAWADETLRHPWLPEPLTVRRATPNKSLRITWPDGSTVSVNFWSKGEAKSQVQVNHEKLPDEAAAATLKAFWATVLNRLVAALDR
jgi:hypothetical protein